MKTVFIRSAFYTLIAALITYFVRVFFKTDLLLPDVSGLSAFATIFGTLYGIITAFIVFETWGEYNKTDHLIEMEAQAWERLYRLTLYFRDKELTAQMKKAIEDYIKCVVEDKFTALGAGKHNKQAATDFRKIAAIIRDVKFDDDHDQTVFDHIIAHYGAMSEIRTERINQSLARLPKLLRTFLYVASGITLVTFVIMPFANLFYSLFTIGALTFILAMVMQLVEDLDNPFVGYWNITTEPFERALKHIRESY